MKPASNKQINFARNINIITKIPLPEEETAQAYFIYIRDNIDEYKRKKRINWLLLKSPHQKRYSYVDEEQDASWAASMDFDQM